MTPIPRPVHWIATTALCAFSIIAQAAMPPTRTQLRLVEGTDPMGAASPQWLAMIRKRLPPDRYAAIAPVHKPMSAEERAWADLIGSRMEAWKDAVPPLTLPYRPVAPPADVLIVIGNRGAEDAFTHDPTTIGFDLAALQANYGDARLPENAARIDRFFRHEFVHLMQKVWLQEHPWPATTTLHAALAEIWGEGLGNYQSLSSRWLSADGKRSETAVRALSELEPRFVARLNALACADREEATALTADLANGRFDRKWGALPAALWLEWEAATNPEALRDFVLAGPEGVWDLADRQLPAPLRAALRDARANATLCRPKEATP